MLVSPFTFYRGAAVIMAADLARAPTSGLSVQACGDAHVLNFGGYASPERHLLFDVNDFDETYPGPWEWDVKRLAASLIIAGRENGFATKDRRKTVLAMVEQYRRTMAQLAGMGDLAVWYARVDLDTSLQQKFKPLDGLVGTLDKTQRKNLSKAIAKARTRDSLQAFSKLAHVVDGGPRIIGVPQLIEPVFDLLPSLDRMQFETEMRDLLKRYRRTLSSNHRILLDRFEVVDMARKVVGVGSVGTRCWIVLLRGRDDGDPLFLQVKEAQRSVLADHLAQNTTPRTYRSEGQRVVAGQRLMQSASDIFLGSETAAGADGQRRDFYVRQLRDWKESAVVEAMPSKGLRMYGALCASTLAHAHARSGDRIAIAGYLGDDSQFPQAITEFAELYADQNELDHSALAAAAETGLIAVQTGV